jgi:hypothetical protein
MATAEGTRLITVLDNKVAAFKAVCKDIDETIASRAPEGRWTPKEIVSHLCGPEGIGFLNGIKRFIEEDTPRIDIIPEQTFMTDRRAGLSFPVLLKEFEEEHRRVDDYIATLTDEQLARKARIPLLKDSPLGEYPTLAVWVQAIADFHIAFHIDHLKEIVQELQSSKI